MKTIKKSIALLLALVMVLAIAPISAFAEDDALNYLEYLIVGDEVCITGYKNDPVNLVIPAEIEGKPVTSIDNSAFDNCNSLESVIIPDSVTSIGYDAFRCCYSLHSIIIPDSVTMIDSYAFHSTAYYDNELNWENGVLYIGNHLITAKTDISGDYEVKNGTKTIAGYAFESCRSLQSITIPDSVTSINSDAFSGCSSLQSITIPDSVTSISSCAFSGCISLQSITIPDSVTSINSNAFDNTAYYNNDSNWENGVLYIGNHLITAKTDISGDYEVKNGTKTIAVYAISGCSSLQSITIPASVTSISGGAFAYCDSLQSITIPASVTSIGEFAFIGCRSLQSITIPASVTSIGEGAFVYCDSLQSITISESVTSISYDAFSGCSSLNSITVADENPVYDSRDNCNAIIETATDTLIVGCANTVIPESVIGIYSAFNGIENIKSITIPDGVVWIFNSFSNCNQLKEISFPDSLKYAMIDFSECIDLEKISIGDIAFENWIAGLEDTKYYQNEANWENDVLYIGNHVAAIRENATGEYVIREGTKTICVNGDYSNMQSVTIPDSVIAMPILEGTPVYNNPDNWENGELYAGNHLIAVDSSITGEYAIRENTKSIAVGGFEENDAIEKVIIPDSISFIPYGCFIGCRSLKNVVIPETVQYIGCGSFAACSSLESIEIPETVEYISLVAFQDCNFLTDAYIYNSDCLLLGLDGELPFDKTVTIHSYAGGKVEEFANRYGYNFVALPPKPHTHTFGEWTVVTPATYAAAGEKTRACTGCEETEIEVIPMLVAENVATNDNTGITVKYDDSVYGENIQLDISEITEGAAFELVNGDNGNGHHKSKLFDINTTVNGVKVQPNGKVLVGIPVPRGFNEKKVVIYYVTDEGDRLEKLDSYVENGIIWFETDHFSYYAVVDESEIVEEKSPWELFLDILRNLFRLILRLFSFSL